MKTPNLHTIICFLKAHKIDFPFKKLPMKIQYDLVNQSEHRIINIYEHSAVKKKHAFLIWA